MKYTTYLTIFSSLALAVPQGAEGSPRARLISNDNAVADRYIVMFKEGHGMDAHERFLGRTLSQSVISHWDDEENFSPPYGYTADLDDEALDSVRSDPLVDFVEQDFYMQMIPDVEVYEVQPSNLRRLSTWLLHLPTANGLVAPEEISITTPKAAGEGVDIYIVDSGINIEHEAFNGRASNFYDVTGLGYFDESYKGGVRGHGTLVADIAGGSFDGAAKRANFFNAIFCSGPSNLGFGSDFVKVVSRINKEHSKRKKLPGFRGSIINYSLDTPLPKENSASLPLVISAADSAGIVQVASAGNSNDESTNHLPAAYTDVITVASMTEQYKLSLSSSYGTMVDVVAPGTGITAAGAVEKDSYYTVSGTSFAAPLVSGVIATWMSYVNGPKTPIEVHDMLWAFCLDIETDPDHGTIDCVINSGIRTREWPPTT